MNLGDALGDWPTGGNQSAGGNVWPGQPSNPSWPGGQPSTNPIWQGGQPSPNPIWQGGNSGSGGWSSPSPGPAMPAAAQSSLSVPYQLNLPNGVYDKLLITIAGVIKPNADKVTVDMTSPEELAFHLNPRFNENGQQVIVRNSCLGKKWGKEERELTRFPFRRGQPFEMKILCTNSEFKVAVDNAHLLSYSHRYTNLRAINTLSIYNDVNLTRVNMETLP